MLPKIIRNLPRTLRIPTEIYAYLNEKDLNGYWFISWLGRSYYKEDKIYREYYVSLCSNEYFNFKKVKTFCLEFPEEFSVRYKQGNYYKFNGDFLKSAFDSKEIKIINDVDFSRIKNTRIINFEKLIEGTDYNYPLYSNDKDGNMFVNPYHDFPCYVIEVNNSKYIVPLNIVQSYFYSISSMNIYHLIYGTLRDSLILPIYIDNEHIVPYRGTVINEQEARFISKFYFLNDANFASIYNIHDSFQMNLMNKKRRGEVLKSYINYGFPFKSSTQLKLSLYFYPIDRLKNINMVYSLGDVRFANSEIFDTMEFYLDNIDASLKESDPDYIQNPGNIKITNIKDEDFEIVNNSVSTNSNMVTEIKIEDNTPKFLQTPNVKISLPSRIREAHGFQQNYINHVIKYDEESHNQDSTSDTGIVNYNVDGIQNTDYMEIILAAFEKLRLNECFDCEYIYLRKQKNSVFSFDPYDFDKKGSIVIFQITHFYSTYCLIARKNNLQRIGIIKKLTEGKFDSENDEKLKSGLFHISKNYRYNWSKSKVVKSSYIKNSFNFEVVHALNKTKGNTKDERINNLYQRIQDIISSKEI